jgi:hypothetical protein
MPRNLPDLKHKIKTLPTLESKYISRVPFIAAAIGGTGSGKTHLGLSLVKLMRREHTITKLYIICPSFKSNVIYHAITKPSDMVFEDINKVYEALHEVEKDCMAISEQYRADLEYQIAFKRYTAGETVNPVQEHLLEARGYREIKPERPSPCLIVDDCSHSPLFSSSRKNPFTNLVLRCRHVGDGLGLSILLMCQTYTSGCPRALRQNLTHLALFNTQSDREIKSMYAECNGQVPFEAFKAMFNHYTKKKHAYMWIDNIRRQMLDSF